MIGPTLSPAHVQEDRVPLTLFVWPKHTLLVPEARGSATAQRSYGGSR